MNDSYLGNANIKRDGVSHDFTKEEVDEYMKCAKNPVYFAEKYVKVIHLDRGLVPFEPYTYQRKMLRHLKNNRFSVILACRQSGKSITSVVFLLWTALFQSEQTIGILANKAAIAKEMLSRITLALENIPFFLQPGCKALNKLSIEFSNNSKIFAASTSSSSIRGTSCVAADTYITVVDDHENIFHAPIKRLVQTSLDVNNDMKTYLVYQIKNEINGKIYVGFHGTHNENDGYMGSGKLIKRAIEKYGPENFKRTILARFDNIVEAEAYERSIVDDDFVDRDDTYNLTLGGNICILKGDKNPFYGKKHPKHIMEKIRAANRGRISAQRTAAVIDGLRVSGWADIAKTLHLKSPRVVFPFMAGDPNNDCYFEDPLLQEAAEKMFLNRVSSKRPVSSRKGKPLSAEHRIAISKGLTGKQKSIEHVMKINNNPDKIKKTAAKLRGQTRSEESKRKMPEQKKGKPARNKGKKHYYNPVNPAESGYYIEANAPKQWVNGVAKCKS